MLIEALEFLATPVAPAFRGTGYLRESIATAARARRCAADWEPHLANSRRVVLAAAEACPERRTCLVLGGGLAHDLPLAKLSRLFRRVLLVDVVHLWPVRFAARRLGNVELVAHDVTESLSGLRAGYRELWAPARFLDDPEIDLAVSLNIASQLPVIPLALLERGGMAEEVADRLGRRMIEMHLDYLDCFRGSACLLMDTERHVLDRGGRLVETVSALRGAVLPESGDTADEAWDWSIAPLGEEGPDHAVVNRVIARTRPARR